ncbi:MULTISPECIES: helix-turn-helix transcriptional regulator [Bacillus cereus group]|uniref:helix-turn-helix transcriptional regulator n=1 Tax=Bacillus cereus group TaxID=86661 RepID=UPI000BEF2879|nr:MULTISPECIES: helix-turn-helix transcriptional regulator [Bacillus cereus group]PEM87327.1 transcriptional regulator [Bacillus toyonensis]PEQ69706.1 transcriptional regulator [Bacillus thuringiensis]
MLKITLRAARVNADLLQIDAANQLEISRYQLMSWEKDPKQIPVGMIEKICRLYKISKDNIFFDIK